jgi:hypothetical protein
MPPCRRRFRDARAVAIKSECQHHILGGLGHTVKANWRIVTSIFSVRLLALRGYAELNPSSTAAGANNESFIVLFMKERPVEGAKREESETSKGNVDCFRERIEQLVKERKGPARTAENTYSRVLLCFIDKSGRQTARMLEVRMMILRLAIPFQRCCFRIRSHQPVQFPC